MDQVQERVRPTADSEPGAYLVNTSRAAIVEQDALLATPHLGCVSRDNYRTYYGQAVENIQAFLAGAPVCGLP